jgi:hypothetical protein
MSDSIQDGYQPVRLTNSFVFSELFNQMGLKFVGIVIQDDYHTILLFSVESYVWDMT